MSIDWPAFAALVGKHEHFVLTSHLRPDCDALGSELGMAAILQALGLFIDHGEDGAGSGIALGVETGAIAGGVYHGQVRVQGAAQLGKAEEQEDQERSRQGELDEALTSFTSTTPEASIPPLG